jgi:hypothetical protein
MYQEEKPYWYWFCRQVMEDRYKQLTFGELFTALLDRMETREIKINGVVEGLTDIAKQLANCHDIPKETEDSTMEMSCKINKYVELLKTKSCEQDYFILLRLSREVFTIILKLNFKRKSYQCDLDSLYHSYRIFIQKLEQLVKSFKEEVTRTHTEYFLKDGRYEPTYLGYMVYCVDIVNRFVKHLRSQVTSPETDTVIDIDEMVHFPTRMISDLFNWTGEFKEIDHYYWRIELNDIMGV